MNLVNFPVKESYSTELANFSFSELDRNYPRIKTEKEKAKDIYKQLQKGYMKLLSRIRCV